MPLGYLMTVTLAACGTLLALAPPSRPRPLREVSMRLGLVVNELPAIVFLWLLASTALAVAEGDAGTPVGLLAAGLIVPTSAGLALTARRALRAGPVVERALHEGLGTDLRPRRRSYARVLLTPFPGRPRNVERIANVRYGPAGKRNRLDVYRDHAGTAGGPVLVYWHGGGYYSGRKNREARLLLHRLASQGWVCVSANYRLRPAATFADHMIDAKKAIAWAREHVHEYGGDPSVLVVAGSSAGGHLASLAALTPNDPAFQPGFEDADTSVTAAISLYGYYGRYYGLGDGTSQMDHDATEAPPFFIAHGDRDNMVPVEGARLFAEKLRNASSQPVVYAELPGAQHSFDLFRSVRFETVVDGIESFATWVHARDGLPR
ncbi:alpha/beta hydrolase [Actinomadura sp. 9N407]|uniref:alpha/beta hydrolase n=1 Tax=Actinomadura sp. 9N407 TaxID=3375154 RepID=UPI0037B652C3